MAFIKKRPVAIAIAVAVCLIALFISGKAGLSGKRAQVESVFYTGEHGDGLCIYGDLNSRADAAYNITTVVKRNDEGVKGLSEVTDAINRLRDAMDRQSIQDMSRADRALGDAVEALYRNAQNMGLDESDMTLVTRQYRSFMSASDTISYDPYNSLARQFNSDAAGFPASLFGVKPLEYFS